MSWVLTERTYRRDPRALTAVMIAAFAVKMVFFGAYVAVMLSVVGLQPVPFVASFTGYFIALYLTEALFDAPPVRGRINTMLVAGCFRNTAPQHAEPRDGAAEKFNAGEVDHRARLEQRPSIIR